MMVRVKKRSVYAVSRRAEVITANVSKIKNKEIIMITEPRKFPRLRALKGSSIMRMAIELRIRIFPQEILGAITRFRMAAISMMAIKPTRIT
jgi:hypothetical protein